MCILSIAFMFGTWVYIEKDMQPKFGKTCSLILRSVKGSLVTLISSIFSLFHLLTKFLHTVMLNMFWRVCIRDIYISSINIAVVEIHNDSHSNLQ